MMIWLSLSLSSISSIILFFSLSSFPSLLIVSSLVNSSFLIHLACSSACCFCLEARWSSISRWVILVCDLSKSLLRPSISILAWLSFISTSASFSESFRSSLWRLFFSFCKESFSSSTSSSLSFRDSNFSCQPSSLACRCKDLLSCWSSSRRRLHSSSFFLKVSLSFLSSFSRSPASLASFSSDTWRRSVAVSVCASFNSRRAFPYLDFVCSCSSSVLSKFRSSRCFSIWREFFSRFKSSCFCLQFSSSFVFSLAFKSDSSASSLRIFSSRSLFLLCILSLSVMCKSSSSFSSSLRSDTSSFNCLFSFFKSSFSSHRSPYISFPFSNLSFSSVSSSSMSSFCLARSSFSSFNFFSSSRTLSYLSFNFSYSSISSSWESCDFSSMSSCLAFSSSFSMYSCSRSFSSKSSMIVLSWACSLRSVFMMISFSINSFPISSHLSFRCSIVLVSSSVVFLALSSDSSRHCSTCSFSFLVSSRSSSSSCICDLE